MSYEDDKEIADLANRLASSEQSVAVWKKLTVASEQREIALAQRVAEYDRQDLVLRSDYEDVVEQNKKLAQRVAAAEAVCEAANWMLHVAHGIGKGGGTPENDEYEMASNAVNDTLTAWAALRDGAAR